MLGWLKKAGATVGNAFDVSAELGNDFYLDRARRDDAIIGARVFVSTAAADGSLDPEETATFAPGLTQLFRNFTAEDVRPFIKIAADSHAPFAEIGIDETEEEIRNFNDDVGSLKKILRFAVAIAKKGEFKGVEFDVLERFAKAGGYTNADIGLPAVRPSA